MTKKKADKKLLSDTINGILGTKIDFTKLNLKDLEEFYEIIANPVELGKRILSAEASARVELRVEQLKDQAMSAIGEFLAGRDKS